MRRPTRPITTAHGKSVGCAMQNDVNGKPPPHRHSMLVIAIENVSIVAKVAIPTADRSAIQDAFSSAQNG